MICLGSQQHQKPVGYDSSVAQLRALELFKNYFLSRYPRGIVISELEYMGLGAIVPKGYEGGIQLANREQNKIIQAMAEDFRRWKADRDFRKPDGIGISIDGLAGELLEVTTLGNRGSAEKQIRDKLDTLRTTVNMTAGLRTTWEPTSWRPGGSQLFYPLNPQSGEVLRYVCYEPTIRDNAQPGTVLYEIHSIKRGAQSVPATFPQDVKSDMKAAYKRRELQTHTVHAWARQFIATHPSLRKALQDFAYIVGVATAVAAVALIFDPVPGDEAVAASASAALFRFALAQ